MNSIERLRRPNFEPEEFFRTETGDRLGINNFTNYEPILQSLEIVADKIQEIRRLLKVPVRITSAYRCIGLNRALGSKDTSQHVFGQAIDFIAPEFGNPAAIFVALQKSDIEVDQCLLETSGKKSWVHVSIVKRNYRNQFGKIINGNFIRA